jgi:hypothetical protein
MATPQLAVGSTGAGRRSRIQARKEAADAMLLASRWLAIDPATLSAAAYRTFLAKQDDPHLPSPVAISMLFFGWHRACEHVAGLTYDEVAVEANVVRALYGDPAGRQRAHATRGQGSTAQVEEPAHTLASAQDGWPVGYEQCRRPARGDRRG